MDKANMERLSFSDVAREWLVIRKPELKTTSISKYMTIVDSYLLPEFGENDVSDIMRRDVMHFSRTLLSCGGVQEQGLSPKSVNGILSVMKNILKYASSERGLKTPDLRDISIKQPQKPMRILSFDEQTKLSHYLCKNISPCNLGILICLYTGLRIGEICALLWSDIHLDEGYIYVHRNMQRVKILSSNEEQKKSEIRIDSPKSDCSIRKVPIPDELQRLLFSYMMEDEAFLLTGSSKKYIEPRCMENRFKAVMKECDISDVNFHALRHTFATRCVELGFDIKSLSEILGHASVNITLNRYVHPSMELKRENMNKLSKLLA